jgi:hypothetical protein
LKGSLRVATNIEEQEIDAIVDGIIRNSTLLYGTHSSHPMVLKISEVDREGSQA